MTRNLMKYLADPSKLASKLDWSKASGCILALDVGQDKIGLAIASHPSFGDAPRALEPMPIRLETRQGNRRALSESVIEDLKKVVESYNVVGFVFSWPLQKEGRCGAPCGKVLHTLDSLVEESNIVNSKRPFCLWDDHHYMPKEDNWGRAPQYGETISGKTLHKASEEQYVHQCSSSIAVEVWNDYCSKHWPQLNSQGDDKEDDIWGATSSAKRRSESNPVAASDEWLDDDDNSYTDRVLFAR